MNALTPLIILPSLGPMELLLILVIVVVIFGARKLPLLGKGLGEGIKNFKKGIKSSSDEAPPLEASQKAENEN